MNDQHHKKRNVKMIDELCNLLRILDRMCTKKTQVQVMANEVLTRTIDYIRVLHGEIEELERRLGKPK